MAQGIQKNIGRVPMTQREYDLGIAGIRSGQPQVTASNAPLWQARKRTSADREMLDAYLQSPTTISGDRFGMKWQRYQNNLAIEHMKRNGLGGYGGIFGAAMRKRQRRR